MESNINRNCNLDIFIYSHIPFRPITTDHVYKVLTHTDELIPTDLEVFRDYEGENIAKNNIMYNEYCGMYWVWKNYPIKDYVGFNHYRRPYITDDTKKIMEYDAMPTMDEIFKKYDIILNEKLELRYHQGFPNAGQLATNREWYAFWHNIDDLDLLGKIIKDKYPKYYDGYEAMCSAKYIYPCSLFTMTYEMFDEYCTYIFGVLGEFRKRRGFFTSEDCLKYVEEHADLYLNKGVGHEYYDARMQSRIIGYIAERALASFLMHGGKNSIEKHAKIFKWGTLPEQAYKIN